MKRNPLNRQVGGSHYTQMPIQHVEFCQRNGIPWCEAAAIKYLVRHRQKNGLEDLRKAVHYIELLIELEYGEEAARTSQDSSPKPPQGEG